MKLPLLLAACLVFFSAGSLAVDAGMYPNVKESKISYDAYQAMYGKQGNSKDFPKIIVFSSSGKCVGVSSDKAPSQDTVLSFITESLHHDSKACDAVISKKFGVSELGKDSGTGKPEIYLFVIDNFPFCTACNEFKQTLLRESHGPLANMQLTIMAVTLSNKP